MPKKGNVSTLLTLIVVLRLSKNQEVEQDASSSKADCQCSPPPLFSWGIGSGMLK